MITGVARAPAKVAESGALADQIAEAVTRCPDVAGLTEVPGIPVATYLPGRTVSGVAVRAGEVEVSVVARYGRPLREIAGQVRLAVAPLVPGRVVDVVIADITSPAQPSATGRAPASRPTAKQHEGEESANE